MTTIYLNINHTATLTQIIGEFVAHRCAEFKTYLDGQHGGWTVEFDSDLSINWWRDVAGSFGGVEAWTDDTRR
jgi:hypothetical protein